MNHGYGFKELISAAPFSVVRLARAWKLQILLVWKKRISMYMTALTALTPSRENNLEVFLKNRARNSKTTASGAVSCWSPQGTHEQSARSTCCVKQLTDKTRGCSPNVRRGAKMLPCTPNGPGSNNQFHNPNFAEFNNRSWEYLRIPEDRL